jgi:hypothetical protein
MISWGDLIMKSSVFWDISQKTEFFLTTAVREPSSNHTDLIMTDLSANVTNVVRNHVVS